MLRRKMLNIFNVLAPCSVLCVSLAGIWVIGRDVVPEVLNTENARAATTLTVGLSSSLIAGSFTMMGAIGALTIFLTDKRKVPPIFFMWVLVSYGLLFASIYCGGKGVSALVKMGFKGDWAIRTPENWFNAQAGYACLGCLVFFTTVLICLAESRKVSVVSAILDRDLLGVLGKVNSQRIYQDVWTAELKAKLEILRDMGLLLDWDDVPQIGDLVPKSISFTSLGKKLVDRS